jgi:hypothetical protein
VVFDAQFHRSCDKPGGFVRSVVPCGTRHEDLRGIVPVVGAFRGVNTPYNDTPYRRREMFIKTRTESKLDAEIQSASRRAEVNDRQDVREYGTLVDHISKLHKLKTEERSKQISPDTVLVVAANIFGILWLTRYEKTDVINSKALGFVMKPR